MESPTIPEMLEEIKTRQQVLGGMLKDVGEMLKMLRDPAGSAYKDIVALHDKLHKRYEGLCNATRVSG